MEGDRIRINVGGKMFETTRNTLDAHPKTRLYRDACKSSDGNLFYDRDPQVFEIVLRWYRTGYMPKQRDLQNWMIQEISFWELPVNPEKALNRLHSFDCTWQNEEKLLGYRENFATFNIGVEPFQAAPEIAIVRQDQRLLPSNFLLGVLPEDANISVYKDVSVKDLAQIYSPVSSPSDFVSEYCRGSDSEIELRNGDLVFQRKRPIDGELVPCFTPISLGPTPFAKRNTLNMEKVQFIFYDHQKFR